MLAVDTNILVRFLVDDDSEQSPKARAFFRNLQTSGVREHALAAACEAVATFDGRLLKQEGFVAPS